MRTRIAFAAPIVAALATGPIRAEIHIYSMDHETGRLIKIKEDGTLLWDCPNRNGHDVQLLPSGNVLIVTGKVQEVDPSKKVVWELGAPTIKSAESAQRLADGHTVIGDVGQMAIIEVDEHNKVVWRYDVANANKRPHPTMRQMRRLPGGNTLISSGSGYGSKAGYFVVEVDPDGKTVWKYGGDDAPADQKLKWPSGFVRHTDGNLYISEAQGRQIRVVAPDKSTVRVVKGPALVHPCTLVIVDG